MKDGFVKVAAGTPRIRVADCGYNAGQIIALMKQAAERGVKVLALPELCVTGYTCGDLFLQDALLDGAEEALERILEETAELDMVTALGLPVRAEGKLYNCAAVIKGGQLLGLVPKGHIPGYGEAGEDRWFRAAPEAEGGVVVSLIGEQTCLWDRQLFACETVPDLTIGVEICEDLLVPSAPSVELAARGATLILNLSASPELAGKAAWRRDLVTCQSGRLVCGYVYADAGEGESTTDLVFGSHNIVAENGLLLSESRFAGGLTVSEIDVNLLAYERRRMTTFPAAREGLYITNYFTLGQEDTRLTRPIPAEPFLPKTKEGLEEILTIAALGLKKRLEHTHAPAAVIGLSGGLDSTLAILTTARAFDLLGRDRKDIVAITMPCFGTTARTKSNAEQLAEELGATLKVIDIGAAVRQHFADIGHDMEDHSVTFENAQARERTQVLMDVANRLGGLVIGTGDLSELALGWCTYNGDHMSMYAVNCSIPKTLVRHLVGYLARDNAKKDEALHDVLEDILDTPVSPELLPAVQGQISQKTEDLVGPYELHDFFLYYMLRWGFSPRKVYRLAVYALGGKYSREVILKWLKTFYRRFFSQQFKRNCVPDGPKVGSVALSPRGDWRMPSDAKMNLWQAELETLE